MKGFLCKNYQIKTIIGLFIFFSVCLSAFFCSPSYAVSDLVKTVPSGTSLNSSEKVFPDCDEVCFSNYKYVVLEMSNVPANNQFPYTLSLRQKASYNYNFVLLPVNFDSHFYSYQVFPIDNTFYALYYTQVTGVSNYDLKITLTESLKDCPPCPDCPPVPVIPENPYDTKFDEIKYAIYVCASVPIMLYFFYCIYRMIIKGVK